jgi:hypothetical protein
VVAFDAVGELAAQPGGRELSALADRVQRIDPEVLRAVGRGLGSMAEGVDGSLAAVGRHGEEVRAAWGGRGAEAFTEYVGDLDRAGRTTLEATGRMRERVDGAGQVLDTLRREVDGHVTRALEAARRARAEALADPARAPLADQLAAQAVAEPTAAARAALARAEADLGDTATLLQELVADARAFSRLPTPDARPIAPPAGAGPSGWSPVAAGGGSIATVPALAESGGSGRTPAIDLAGGGGSSDGLSSATASSSSDTSSSSVEALDEGTRGDGSPDCSDAAASDETETETETETDASGSRAADPGVPTGGDADAADGGSMDGGSAADAPDPEASTGAGDADACGQDAQGDDAGAGSAADVDAGARDDDTAAGSGADVDAQDDATAADSATSAHEDDTAAGSSGDADGQDDGVAAGGSEAGSDAVDDTAASADAEGQEDDSGPGAGTTGDVGPPDDADTGTDAAAQDDAPAEAEDDDAAGGSDADTEPADEDTTAGAEESTSAGGEDADADEDADEDGASTDAAVDPDASGDAAPTGGPQGQVGDWIREAMAVLQAEGVPVDKMDPDDIATIIEHESGGDPEATNDWDSNAAKGTPSQGLMQTIGPTFDSYKLEGHDEIKDPVDNIIAGVRYAIDRYGSVSQVPGVEAVARGDAYVGY